jgi:hypothetical protein
VLDEGQPLFEKGIPYATRPGEPEQLAFDFARGALEDAARARADAVSVVGGGGVGRRPPRRRTAPREVPRGGGGIETLGVGITTALDGTSMSPSSGRPQTRRSAASSAVSLPLRRSSLFVTALSPSALVSRATTAFLVTGVPLGNRAGSLGDTWRAMGEEGARRVALISRIDRPGCREAARRRSY